MYVPHNPFLSAGEKGCPYVITWIYTVKKEMVNNTITFEKQPGTGQEAITEVQTRNQQMQSTNACIMEGMGKHSTGPKTKISCSESLISKTISGSRGKILALRN